MLRDNEGRIIVIDIVVDGNSFTLGNMYAPNEDLPNFFLRVTEIMDQFHCPHRMIGGDFNLCFNVDLDTRGTTYNNDRALEILRQYMDENYMVDVWYI